jgi:hypothetical protein
VLLATTGERLGEGYWLVLGPIVAALAIAAAVFLVIRASRRSGEAKPDQDVETEAGRGPVRGGIIEGDPGQRNRRD